MRGWSLFDRELSASADYVEYIRLTPEGNSGIISATPHNRALPINDLQRYTAEEGVGWGVDWVIEALIRENLKPIDADDAFEGSIRDCFPELVKVLWLELDAVSIVKELDPISWQMAVDEWVESEESEGQLVTFDFGSNYYATPDVETFLDEQDFDEIELAQETAG